MSGTRTIEKQLATMEDLACGLGKVSQNRGGTTLVLGRIMLPYAVIDEAALKALDVSKFDRAFLNNTYYIYNPDATEGIAPSSGRGFWVEDVISNNVREQTLAQTNEMTDTLLNIKKFPTTNTDAQVGDEIPLGTSAIRANGRLYYLATAVSPAGTLTDIDLGVPKVTIESIDYKMDDTLPVPAAINSPNAGAGFGGFRYTVTGSGSAKTLHLYTT